VSAERQVSIVPLPVTGSPVSACPEAGIGIAYGADWVTQECRKRRLI
jgi:hypothetical protein